MRRLMSFLCSLFGYSFLFVTLIVNAITFIYVINLLQVILNEQALAHKRQRRYLIFTPSTQWGVFVTVSVPLPHPETLVSVAWFFEANYYNVANASYLDPLLGDVDISSSRRQRDTENTDNLLTRRNLYVFIESMLEKHGYPGRDCLLRAICESPTRFLHDGILGDLLHLVLTPSTSISEDDLEDCYYEAEYWGLEKKCGGYEYFCPLNPIDVISMEFE